MTKRLPEFDIENQLCKELSMHCNHDVTMANKIWKMFREKTEKSDIVVNMENIKLGKYPKMEIEFSDNISMDNRFVVKLNDVVLDNVCSVELPTLSYNGGDPFMPKIEFYCFNEKRVPEELGL